MSAEPVTPDTGLRLAHFRSPKRGHVRWIVCALLLFATTINYIDRQVLGILAPTLQKEIGWTEVQYGYIVTAFQAAYAIGLLLVGRILDRIGTQARLRAVDRRSGVSRPWPTRWSRTPSRLRHGALRPRPRRSGQLPRGDQDGRRVVPEARARARYRHLQRGHATSARSSPRLIVPVIALTWGWQCGVRDHRRASASSGWSPGSGSTRRRRSIRRLRAASSPTSAAIRRRGDHEGPVGAAHRQAPDLGLRARQVPDRSGLVVLPLLAAASS